MLADIPRRKGKRRDLLKKKKNKEREKDKKTNRETEERENDLHQKSI
jgi:hypothetical protein